MYLNSDRDPAHPFQICPPRQIQVRNRKTDLMIFTYWQAGKHDVFSTQVFGLSVRRHSVLWLVYHC